MYIFKSAMLFGHIHVRMYMHLLKSTNKIVTRSCFVKTKVIFLGRRSSCLFTHTEIVLLSVHYSMLFREVFVIDLLHYVQVIKNIFVLFVIN
jgi:hypothetical protein